MVASGRTSDVDRMCLVGVAPAVFLLSPPPCPGPGVVWAGALFVSSPPPSPPLSSSRCRGLLPHLSHWAPLISPRLPAIAAHSGVLPLLTQSSTFTTPLRPLPPLLASVGVFHRSAPRGGALPAVPPPPYILVAGAPPCGCSIVSDVVPHPSKRRGSLSYCSSKVSDEGLLPKKPLPLVLSRSSLFPGSLGGPPWGPWRCSPSCRR